MTTAAKAVNIGKPLKGYVLKVNGGRTTRYDYPDGSTLIRVNATGEVFEIK